MKKFTNLSVSLMCLLLFILTSTYSVYAIDHTINFTGSGASTTVDSVIVQNLTWTKSVTVPKGYMLKLIDVTAVEHIEADNEIISIIPNPITEKSVVSFYAKQAGNTQINVVGIDGRILTGINCNLPEGKNSFQLSLDKGSYILRVNGNGFSYSSMILSRSGMSNIPKLSFIGNEIAIQDKPQKSKNTDVVTMTYTLGDQMLYKGCSGNFSTIVTDKLTSNNTINFEFVECNDADGNNYSVVKIGTQTWMAENLKTTKYSNGEAIGTTSTYRKNISGESAPKYQWTCNGNGEDPAKYGKLYTWYVVADNRNIVSAGWHVPTETEWRTLIDYMIANGYSSSDNPYGYEIAKALAATTDWYHYSSSDLKKNNSSGFTALPSGYRVFDGEFYPVGFDCHWWSSTEYKTIYAWHRGLQYDKDYIIWTAFSKNCGLSVRCIRD